MKSKVIEPEKTPKEPVWEFPCIVTRENNYCLAIDEVRGYSLAGVNSSLGCDMEGTCRGKWKDWSWLPITHPVTIEFTP